MSTPSTPHGDSSGPIHIAITRRVRPGREAEYQKALREFFQLSFAHEGVLGASMIVPPPGSNSLEYGILRTFAGEKERIAFYESPMFKAWEERVRPLAEDEWTYHQLHGLDAWFRSAQSPPPRWKMALLTWLAVWPVSMGVRAIVNPLIGQSLPNVLHSGIVAAGIVAVLTWAAMPLIVKIAHRWLRAPSHRPSEEAKSHTSTR